MTEPPEGLSLFTEVGQRFREINTVILIHRPLDVSHQTRTISFTLSLIGQTCPSAKIAIYMQA